MLLELRRLTIPPGQRVLLEEVSWDEFEAILEELGDRRAARVAYDNGLLEIMTPLPEHENSKVVIGDFIKAILIDITSRTHPSLYEALGVPELWRFEKSQLQIHVLQSDGKYAVQERSSIFPNLPIVENLSNFVQHSKTIGRNTTLKGFRQWVRKFAVSLGQIL